MKVYISSHCILAARHVAAELRDHGHEIISGWHRGTGPMGRTRDKSLVDRVTTAARNVDEIPLANALVLVSAPDFGPGGKFVEAGVAIGNDIPVIVLGRRENLLLWHPMVYEAEDIEEVCGILRELNPDDSLLAELAPLPPARKDNSELQALAAECGLN